MERSNKKLSISQAISRCFELLTPDSPEQEQIELQAERVKLLYNQAYATYVASIVNALILCAVEWHSDKRILLTWCAALFLSIILRTLLVKRYYQDNPIPEESWKWAKLFILGIITSGMLWGLAGILFLEGDSLAHQTFIAFLLGGMAAASTTVISSVRNLPFFFSALVLSPIAFRFIFASDLVSLAIGTLCFCFLFVTFHSSRRNYKSISTSLLLSARNKQLLKRLKSEKSRTESLNTILKKEIEVRKDTEQKIRETATQLAYRTLELDEAVKEANAASNAKSEFLAAMSHEIRTPMNAIIVMTDLLLESKLKKDQRSHLDMVVEAAKSLLVIINDILDHSKFEAGKLILRPRPTSIKDLVEKLISMFDLRADKKGVILISQLDDDLPPYVKTDPDRLRQVLINLVENSIKFTNREDVVLLLVLVEKVEDGFVTIRFAVADSGIGIPRDRLEAIFESFTQAGSDIKRESGGTGLGLTISNEITSMLGGTLNVESIENRGSRFDFILKLPLVNEEDLDNYNQLLEPHDPATEGSLTQDKYFRILCAEDNPFNRRAIEAVLNKNGFAVTIANDGKAALEEYKSNEFDLILMDCQMPLLDGYQTTQEIRKIEESTGKHVPIVALTAYAMSGAREKCLEAGMDDYISKPIDRDALFEMMHKLLIKGTPTA